MNVCNLLSVTTFLHLGLKPVTLKTCSDITICFFSGTLPSVLVAKHRQVLYLKNYPHCPESGRHVPPCHLHSPPLLPCLPTPPLRGLGRTSVADYPKLLTTCLWRKEELYFSEQQWRKMSQYTTTVWEWVTMHNTRSLKLKQLNENHWSVISLFTSTECFSYCDMSNMVSERDLSFEKMLTKKVGF